MKTHKTIPRLVIFALAVVVTVGIGVFSGAREGWAGGAPAAPGLRKWKFNG